MKFEMKSLRLGIFKVWDQIEFVRLVYEIYGLNLLDFQ